MTEPIEPNDMKSDGTVGYRFKSVPATIEYYGISAHSQREAIERLESNPNEFTDDEWATIQAIFLTGLDACEKAEEPYLPLIAEAKAIESRVLNAPKFQIIVSVTRSAM
jgi:hypothetical protein